ncbi:hypothetical protein [Bailinhaonella thermotolerans]|uniref:Uncharacterized protein n=1 Tax=Bailinhaonella thermotolerans TaxID=1070861 RepID=A0A3A4BKD6_9ACTN|nr:hypothetical protein [Bailinhaonella thermotolerans]RJL31612.1 hypothetical protein D5H75_17985 [Bailinhaonella thermotolerans]
MSADEPTVLITVRLPRGARLRDAMDRLELDRDEVDVEYGLVPVDPDDGLYALRVTRAAAVRAGQRPDAEGPFADPRIEPFGPPEPREDD